MNNRKDARGNILRGRGALMSLLLVALLLFAAALSGCGGDSPRTEVEDSSPVVEAGDVTEGAVSIADAVPDEMVSQPVPRQGAPDADASTAGAVTGGAAASGPAVDKAPDKAAGDKKSSGKDAKKSTSKDKSSKDGKGDSGKKPASSDKPAEKDKNSKGVKDKYKTDPVPDGKPAPKEPQEQDVDKAKSYSCTLYVGCGTILDNMDKLDAAKKGIVPKDGVIYAKKKVKFNKGESVFDVLVREMKANKIHLEFVNTPMYNSAYIEGIANLYEFDCGDLSGWMYNVNGWYPNYGCSRYEVKDGDAIEWRYTCDLGRDLGTEWIK
jgi:hypothetical protein